MGVTVVPPWRRLIITSGGRYEFVNLKFIFLAGGFQHFLFSPLPGEMIQNSTKVLESSTHDQGLLTFGFT